MTYGTIKVDTVTFTDAGIDKSVTLSGLVQNPTFSGNVTVTGTLSGVTVTGTTANFTSGNFTNISGGTHTITSGVFAAGSAASPSITFTGDLNTGIYSPGADQVAISTGGSGRLFVDASGNVGIGGSASFPLDVITSGITEYTRFAGNVAGGVYSVSQNLAGAGNGRGCGHRLKAGNGNVIGELYAQHEGGTTNGSITLYGWQGGSQYANLAFDNNYSGSYYSSPIAHIFNTAGSERLRITSAGFVGVGTSSPSHKLDVQGGVISAGNGTIYGGIGYSTRPEIGAISNHDCGFITNNTTRMLLDTSGRLGIGTTSPQELLHVNTGSSGGQVLRLSTNGADTGYLYQNSGAVVLGAYSTRILGFETNGTERARIDSSGRLLVGTSSGRNIGTVYQHRLQIETTQYAGLSIVNNTADTGPALLVLAKSRGTSVGSVNLVQANDVLGSLTFAGADGTDIETPGASIEAFVDGTPGANDMPGRLVFSTTADGASSPTERLRITSAGLVGVGTSSPSDPLHIAVSGANSANIRLQSGDGRTYNIGSTGSGYGNSGKFIIYDITAGAERFCVNSSGNVGIGTTSPSQLLHIQGASSPAFLSLDTRNNVNAYMFAGNTEAVFGAGSAHPVTFRVTDLERARIDTSGRLLVGTSSASAFTFGGVTPRFQVEGADASTGTVSIARNSNDANGAGLIISKSRGTTAGSNTIVSNNDTIADVRFEAGDGTQKTIAGAIGCQVDGTPGANDMPGRLVFSTTADGASSPTERMRITNSGDLLVDSTSSGARLTLRTATDGSGLGVYVNSNNATQRAIFVYSDAAVADTFRIYSNGNAVNTNSSYGAISDIKLKENIVDANSQWDDIKNLQVRNYNFKEGQAHRQIGLIAQEAELVSPGLVYETPDFDAEGNDLGTTTKVVQYSVLYMKAVKALQEAMERIETLEAKVAALENS